jgi:predicted unusual protein kinase regulating ubiquinone biosynthesis (AarF/ABC1/UbiB family)
MIEEFVKTTRFQDLPRRSLIGPSKANIARAAVREGMFALVFDEWLEPDPHTGNRHALAGWFRRIFPKLVVMDLGQGSEQPIERLKPMMRAGMALEMGDISGAAQALAGIVQVPAKSTPQEVAASIEKGLTLKPDTGLVERLMDGLIEAEKIGALVFPEYASLQKAMVIYTGYAEYLPKDFLFKSLERGMMARLLRDRPVSVWSLFKLWVKRTVLGRKAVRAEMEALIDQMSTRLPQAQPPAAPAAPVAEVPAQDSGAPAAGAGPSGAEVDKTNEPPVPSARG